MADYTQPLQGNDDDDANKVLTMLDRQQGAGGIDSREIADEKLNGAIKISMAVGSGNQGRANSSDDVLEDSQPLANLGSAPQRDADPNEPNPNEPERSQPTDALEQRRGRFGMPVSGARGDGAKPDVIQARFPTPPVQQPPVRQPPTRPQQPYQQQPYRPPVEPPQPQGPRAPQVPPGYAPGPSGPGDLLRRRPLIETPNPLWPTEPLRGPYVEPIPEPGAPRGVPQVTHPEFARDVEFATDHYNKLVDGARTPGTTAILTLQARPAREFKTPPGAKPGASIPAIFVKQVRDSDVADACPKHGQVQSLTDHFTQAARSKMPGATAQQLGTEIHERLKDHINALNNPNFRAEDSMKFSGPESYGARGSVRTDVFENVVDARGKSTGTVCIYDLKTGTAGLSSQRMQQLANHAHSFYPGTQRLFVIEVRPR